ncbi:MAG: TauD/TfdA family dioxygenase [Pseudomonadota bacterium]
MSADKNKLINIVNQGKLILVQWESGNTGRFHPIWLRDNCRCEACGEPAVGYRNLRLTHLSLDEHPAKVEHNAFSMQITWQDGHRSEYTEDWLRQHCYDDDARRKRCLQPLLWDDSFRKDPEIFSYRDVSSDQALLDILVQLRDRGICFLREAPAEAGIVDAFASRIGFPQESNFGKVQDLRFDPNERSIAFDVKALKPHTDEPYRATPPGILMFHCIRNDQTGIGASTFIDGFEIAEQLRNHDPQGFAALCQNSQTFRRHYPDEVDLIAEFPVISTDEFGNLSGVRINDRVAAPACIRPEQVEAYYRGMQYLLALSEDPAMMLELTLQPGDIAIFDNHRVLHGRTDLTVEGERWLQWVQIERGDFHSKIRILADQLGLERDITPMLKGAYGNQRSDFEP